MAFKYATGDLENLDQIIKKSKEDREREAQENQERSEQFVRIYMRAIVGGGTIGDVATLCGLNVASVGMKASTLRKAGVPLPHFPKRKALNVQRLIQVMQDV